LIIAQYQYAPDEFPGGVTVGLLGIGIIEIGIPGDEHLAAGMPPRGSCLAAGRNRAATVHGISGARLLKSGGLT
jgi:hypothetical protein